MSNQTEIHLPVVPKQAAFYIGYGVTTQICYVFDTTEIRYFMLSFFYK